MNPENLQDVRREKIVDNEVGQMFLIYDKILVARCSTQIVFFQQIWNKDDNIFEWK